MSLFPGRWQTLGWMSHLLSDLSFRQPRWLHRDEEENDDEDGDNDLKRQVIYNNFRSDDDYCGVCKVDRYQGLQRQQDDTTAAATEVKVQRPNLDNVVNSTLPTKLRHDGNTFDYDHHDEDDEHDYNTHLHAKQRHQFPNRSRFVNNTLFALALLQKTLTRLLTISLSAASALYLLHLIPKCAHDFFIVEILWGLFKTFHWTWYLIAVWPIRSVLWCLAAAVHVLMMLIWPSKTTLVIEFHVVIIYFLRRLRIEMMVKGAK
ncbi:hypothetical protein BGX24_011718 [Mortierella sp. AD032]|nr:hypothetical protein BGX24_011718 [Mortierella sp. AD032]